MTTLAAVPSKDRYTSAMCLEPGGSLSGTSTTWRSRRASAYAVRHFPAPPAFVVAVQPSAAARSQSFSPSKTNIASSGSAATMAGRL